MRVISAASSSIVRRYARNAVLILLDASAAGASLSFALALRMNGDIPPHMVEGLMTAVPLSLFVTAAIFYGAGVHRRVWRFFALADFAALVEAATAAILFTVLTLFVFGKVAWMPASVPIIQWFIFVVMLAGTRMLRGAVRRGRNLRASEASTSDSADAQRALIVGPADHVEILLRQLEVTPDAGYRPVGILDDTGHDVRLRLRGVPILGSFEALEHVVKKLEVEHRRPHCLIIACGGEGSLPAQMVHVATEAQNLGLSVARAANPAKIDRGDGARLSLQELDLSVLLGRPQACLDNAVITHALAGRRILVTGAGGTIGRELVHQIAAIGPSELILLDAGEYNLYSIDMELQENFPDIPRTAVLCSIRQRESVMRVFADHRPEIVFHAAALKHVPLVEQNPCSGVQTNVLGTRNVADAAKHYNVWAMVQISSDKAVNPVGIMGATKRLGELYCQALDLAGGHFRESARFMTVRFGNVLGSSGSLIPLFQRQLDRQMPLTVTHPDIERYFMTVYEAVQLTLQSTACALQGDVRRGRIFVLDMGQPIKVIDIARRMIGLAGLKPDDDVKIEIVGLRPGEKLYEELFDNSEKRLKSSVPGVFEAEPRPVSLGALNRAFDELTEASARGDVERVRACIARTLAGGAAHIDDLVAEARDRAPAHLATVGASRATPHMAQRI